jgi:two-component system, sensor histidine kinase and response regulator
MPSALDYQSVLLRIPVRVLISRIGLIVAILVAVASPLSFWLLSANHLKHDLEFKAKLNSDRIARLIFANETLWQYQGIRIAELIELGNASSEPIRQIVRTGSGSAVTQLGYLQDGPSVSAVQPIVVRGQTVGHVELATSLWPSIYLTMLVGMLSSLLGLAVFYVLRVLPISALDRAMGDLEAANAEVRSVNAALELKNSELSGFNEGLEKLVAERTEEAKAAAEQAKQASQVKSAFLASMSHEIRTPMNGVLGMADLLTRTPLSIHQQRLVTTINHSARTLLKIINDILDFSRIEAGKLELDEQEFNLAQCVESAVELLAEDAYKKQLELNVLLPSMLPAFVVGDMGRLRQVLVNLIGNAVKFTKEGEVTVRVAECGERDGKSVIRISVADTGIGIDAAAKERLFMPFSQADSSISRGFGGTGLGLSITSSIVGMMGGEVSLDSEIGKGTTVSFEVLVAKSDRNSGPEVVCPVVIRGQRVLVVDDRAVNREIVCSYLQDCGALTETANSAEEALALLKASVADNREFALAVLDMIMPGVNGLELARRIRAAPELGETRLIMVTSLSWKGDSKSARDAGIGEFLSKPIRRGELLDAVRRCFAAQVIPVQLADLSSIRSFEALPASASASRGALARLRVLVAEDNPVNQEVAREYAMSLGCECVIADNGRLAVEAYAASKFDVVLMDCQMPEMDGLTACRKIRDLERERGGVRTPIIAVTANAYDSDRMMCLAADMDDFMGKPFTEDQLADVLLKWCGANLGDAAEAGQSELDTAARDELDAVETLDVSALGAFEKQRTGMAARLAEMFLMTAPKSVRQIMMSIVEADHDKIAVLAHGLKSSSANIGALELQRLAVIIENQALEKSELGQCLATAVKLENEICKVETALSRTSWLMDTRKAG